ncbi:hypothetical protein SBA4_1710002 [Candidatus Sulfopaludibacter sp. SbA4]|nr:hypothetical protein SBA4_1710002 [Candidatus Sulfopaludibacter sp. SbA4]
MLDQNFYQSVYVVRFADEWHWYTAVHHIEPDIVSRTVQADNSEEAAARAQAFDDSLGDIAAHAGHGDYVNSRHRLS